jgi:hypothetical protein
VHLANYLGLHRPSRSWSGPSARSRPPTATSRTWPSSASGSPAMVGQAAQGARDADLFDVVRRCEDEVTIQLKWLRTRMKQAAPQALIVAD